ncbi:MAG: extracellular solute-binding protein [Clostridiales bacterium]|nr:extracellular solute-binding protein [Clostridiales bacterium]
MKPGYKRAAAVVLVLSFLFSLSACKKTNKIVTEVVKEDDPYFDVQEIQARIKPESEDMICSVFSAKFIGDYVVSQCIFTKKPTSPDEDLYSSEAKVAVFDLTGELVSLINLDVNCQVEEILCGAHNEIMLQICEYDENAEVARYLCEYTPQGERVRQISLTFEDVETWIFSFGFLEDGRVLIQTTNKLICTDKEGDILWSFEDTSDETTITDSQLFHSGSDWYLHVAELTEDYSITNAFFRKIDLNGHKLSDTRIVNPDVEWGLMDLQDGYYVSDMSGLYKQDILSGAKVEVINWNSIDYNYLTFAADAFKVISQDELYSAVIDTRPVYENDSFGFGETYQTLKLVHMKRAPRNPHAGKALITVGLYEGDSASFIDYTVRYNTVPDGLARIIIRIYNDQYLKKAGADRSKSLSLIDLVYEEMLSGTGPDILMNFSEYGRFNSDKILLDLNPFIDGESGFNRSDYFDNVFRAFEVKGKMYQIPVCIDIAGFVANGELIGARSGWTCSEFDQVVGKLPENVQVLAELSREDLLETILSNSMNSFIDYEKKEVFFDGEEFKQVLETAKKYGFSVSEETDYVTLPLDDPELAKSATEKMDEGKLALLNTYIYTLTQICINRRLCNEKAIFVGYPSADGSGMSARPRMTLGISAYSNYTKEAWDFIRFMFNYDEQVTHSQYFSSIPLSRSAFHKCNQDEMERNAMLRQEIIDLDLDEEDFRWLDCTEQDEEEYRKLVESVSTIYLTDQEIMDEIRTGAAFFFSDKKDIEEVVTEIQAAATDIVKGRDKEKV